VLAKDDHNDDESCEFNRFAFISNRAHDHDDAAFNYEEFARFLSISYERSANNMSIQIQFPPRV